MAIASNRTVQRNSIFSEIPSYLFCMFTLDHIGRKPLFASSMFLTGIFTLICAGVKEGQLKTLLALIGKRHELCFEDE